MTMRTLSRALAFAALTLFVACHRATPPAPSAPPTLRIFPHRTAVGGDTLPCVGAFCDDPRGRVGGDMELVLNDAGLNVNLRTAPGNTVTFDGHDVVVKSDAEDVTFPHMLARVADVRALDDWLDVDVTVRTPDGQSVSGKTRLGIGDAMRRRLASVRSGPVRFAGETATASAGKVAYVMPFPTVQPPRLVGDGRFRDVDLVVFEEREVRNGAECKVHPEASGIASGRGRSGGVHGAIHLTLYVETMHVKLEAWDRRAGKRVAGTELDGPPTTCPGEGKLAAQSGLAGLGGFAPPRPEFDEAAVDGWVRTQLAH